MVAIDGARLRLVTLEVVNANSKATNNRMESGAIIREVSNKLNATQNADLQEAILTYWHDLICSGQIAWGHSTNTLGGPNPAFCFLTDRGRETLKHLSRDPHNPDGYKEQLRTQGQLSPVAWAYVEEALKTYSASCYKATAVMIGAAAESLVLDLRDAIQNRLHELGKPIDKNKKLKDWKAKTVFDEIAAVLTKQMDESYKANPN